MLGRIFFFFSTSKADLLIYFNKILPSGKDIFKVILSENMKCLKNTTSETIKLALAGVTQWIECWPENQRVTGSIPSQGIRLSCGLGPQ